ncbi:efflux RND transporter periplasmic adaptor subunit [uncultured Mucilaginibacter sp.]|uniref:efflux RND transporter periplasmic adaptor subunit n=1 Tax=uncultured Mucilaginibacter sp. TaxID=797541 RepID=UPI00262B78B6|nr:efflux RND transporter periplasmic adaptor subunit [uncultured Mucilaginibacter sp.]
MKNKYITLVLLIVSATWISCSKSQKKSTAIPPTPVNVQAAEKTDATYYDQFAGTVVALNSVELRSQVAGFITGIFFKEGDVVPKGKTLYEIDRRLYEATYQQAQANLVSAQASLNRAQKDADRYTQLLKQDAVARQLVDNAIATLETSRSQVAVAVAGVRSARANLSYSIIKAPFTGRIGISQVRLGAQISPGSTLLNTISSENPIAVDFVVDESNISRFDLLLNKRVKQDSTFKMVLPTGETYAYPGKIAVIDRGVNNQTGTIKVRVRFPNPKDKLVDGMSCSINVLNKASGDQVVIPNKAVVEQMGEYFVYLAKDTIAKQIKVTTGPKVNSNIVILSGIKAGDKIITEGLQRLRDGAHITLGAPKPAPQGQPGK